jgi:hypothetical protein
MAAPAAAAAAAAAAPGSSGEAKMSPASGENLQMAAHATKGEKDILSRSAFRLPPDQRFEWKTNRPQDTTRCKMRDHRRPVVVARHTLLIFFKTKIILKKKCQRTSPEQSSCGRMGGICLRIPNQFSTNLKRNRIKKRRKLKVYSTAQNQKTRTEKFVIK